MVLDCLAQVLDDAVEYELLDTNPARGKRRRMRLPQSRRSFLEPDQVVDLLDAAGRWERELLADDRFADRVIRGRRAMLATLCLAGPRINELTAATRARLDVHGGRLRIGAAKTEAGLRDLELTAFLLDEVRPPRRRAGPVARGPWAGAAGLPDRDRRPPQRLKRPQPPPCRRGNAGE
jgi:integrase